MESCARVVGLLPEFLEGDLPAGGPESVGAHLRACSACQKRAEGHLRTLEALDSLPQVVPPRELRLAVMREVRKHPLPLAAARDRRRHLRLVKSLFWAALVAGAALASGATALALGRASLGRASLADPSLLTEWMVALGQTAFAWALSIATRADFPSPFSLPRGFPLWTGAVSWFVLLVATFVATGFGIFATARAVFRPRSR